LSAWCAATWGRWEVPADDWACAQELLRKWSTISTDFPATGTCRRLRDALYGLSTTGVGRQDVASLVRQALLEHDARQGVQIPLRVRAAPPFPTRQQWQQAGCNAVAEGPEFSVSAKRWHPPVSPGESEAIAAENLLRAHQTRLPPERGHTADPFWSAALGYQSYLSLGQRQSARTVVLAPPGSTTIVCLPTGQGKTEVALAAALLASRNRGTSVMVVPTVVLAIDQERRIRELLKSQGERQSPTGMYSYTGGLAEQDKEDLRRDIREGRQRIVVTSPEALTTGLTGSLAAAAANGYLKYLVIDEAHLVDQWGSDFRPEFQTMASHRLAWLSMAPPGRQVVTVAMSATLTQRHIRILTELFGTQGNNAVVWSSETRPEPSYYLSSAQDDQQRRETVLTAVSLLPRPLVLYATEKQDVLSWADLLRSSGFHRVAHVTGDSSDEQRRSVIEGWHGRDSSGQPMTTQYDIVVGTSAFGLGVDVPDVRSVVHACLPETLDRYYQEVGRSGRDGRPSIAYLVTAPHDRRVARQLNQRVVISVEKGWDRWRSMLRDAETPSPGVYEVSLDSCPTNLSEGYNQNRQWNVRTLNLMVWASLIRLHAPQPPARIEGEPVAEWVVRRDAFYATAGQWVTVEIMDGATNRPEHWAEAVSVQRELAKESQGAALDRIHEVLRGARCIGEVLADYYTAHWRSGVLSTEINCRSCPWCRLHQVTDPDASGMCRVGAEPFPGVYSWPSRPDPLADVRGESSWLSITWRTEQERDDLLPEFLKRLVRRGMPVLGGPGLNPTLAEQVQGSALPAPVITDYDDDLASTFAGPLIWVLDRTTRSVDGSILDRLGGPDPTYLVHSHSLPAPGRPQITLAQICDATLSLTTALGGL
jgi:ATP-dependent DNA helicase RecQ